MLASPTPNAEEARANAVFDALLWSLSRPGLVRTLPGEGEEQIVEALVDRECRAYASDPLFIPAILRTGAEITEIGRADHVFLGEMQGLEALKALEQGSDLYPDGGATAVVRAALTEGEDVLISGPGVEGSLRASIGNLPSGFWQARRDIMRYPMGFDLFLLDGAAVMGLPRSATVEAL